MDKSCMAKSVHRVELIDVKIIFIYTEVEGPIIAWFKPIQAYISTGQASIISIYWYQPVNQFTPLIEPTQLPTRCKYQDRYKSQSQEKSGGYGKNPFFNVELT